MGIARYSCEGIVSRPPSPSKKKKKTMSTCTSNLLSAVAGQGLCYLWALPRSPSTQCPRHWLSGIARADARNPCLVSEQLLPGFAGLFPHGYPSILRLVHLARTWSVAYEEEDGTSPSPAVPDLIATMEANVNWKGPDCFPKSLHEDQSVDGREGQPSTSWCRVSDEIVHGSECSQRRERTSDT